MKVKPRVAIVAGTHPEILKLAPVHHALARTGQMDVRWIHTGQQGATALELLDCFGVRPAVELLRHGRSLEEFGIGCRTQLDTFRARWPWDACIVQGGTESAFAGALSAFYGRTPVLHVEAGQGANPAERSAPGAALREMISRLAALHFVPSAQARNAVLDQGIPVDRVLVVGSTAVDAQQWLSEHRGVHRNAAPQDGGVLVVALRREHGAEEMHRILRAVADVACARPDVRVLFEMNADPAFQRAAHEVLGALKNVERVPPLDHLATHRALANAALLLTDSGELREEVPAFGVPAIVLQREAQHPDPVLAGCALAVAPEREEIVRAACRLLDERCAAHAMRDPANPLDDGCASHRIAAAVHRMLGVPTTSVHTRTASRQPARFAVA